jgi:hypothetical protein
MERLKVLVILALISINQVHFGLSSEDTSNNNARMFNYIKFYMKLHKYLESLKFSDCVGPLIEWWNK